jgi:S1-C subfamily serine protease
MEKEVKKIMTTTIILSVVISSVVGGAMGFWAGSSVRSKGVLGIVRLALTGKDNIKEDSVSCKINRACEQPVSTSTTDKVLSAVASTTQSVQIIRPWLGVRYIQITPAIAGTKKLSVNYGALVVRGEQATDLAVSPGSPADKAGIVENDIILSLNGKKLDDQHPLSTLISNLKPGSEITLRILHNGEQKSVKVELEETK